MKTAALLLLFFAAACTSSAPAGAPPATATSASEPPAAAAADGVRVHVTLSGARPTSDVVSDLEKRGFVVEERLDKIDVVTGHAPRDAMPALRAVDGVKAVEEEQKIQLAPPGKPE
ncbi:MAG TPA: hypothetical protein VHB21_04250 [Minicystis sp.]|nr:hypothetical protein [Minicystis sp.]